MHSGIIKKLGGLNKQMPVTGATSLVGSMSIAGVPPFNGFWSKLIIVIACVQAGYYGLALAAVLVSILTLAILLKVQKNAFFESARATLGRIQRAPVLMAAAMVLLAVLCLAMAFIVITGFESPMIVRPAADALINGTFTLPPGGAG